MNVVATGIASSNSFKPRGFPLFDHLSEDGEQAGKSLKVKVRRTLRTVMFNDAGTSAGAKLDFATGEILPHAYKDFPEQGPKARRNPDAPDLEPFWVKSIAATPTGAAAPETKKKRGRPTTVHTNSLKTYLAGFNAPGFALASLPFLDNIVTGAVNLDLGGNTRPLAKKLVISLLQRLDVISAEAVRQQMHLTLRPCSERHAQKIGQCLRVIEIAAATVAKTRWPAPPTFEIESCGMVNCSVCARSGTEAPTPDADSCGSDDGDFAVETDRWSEAD